MTITGQIGHLYGDAANLLELKDLYSVLSMQKQTFVKIVSVFHISAAVLVPKNCQNVWKCIHRNGLPYSLA